MNEVAHYPQLAESLETAVKANLRATDVQVKVLYLREHGNDIRSFLAHYIQTDGVVASEALKTYAADVPKLRTDLAVLLDNPATNKFSLIIIEAKLLGSAGLTQLSQLIGYCLVTRAPYGLMVNINGGASGELTTILNVDQDIARIQRTLSGPPHEITHKIGFLTYSTETKNLSYVPTSSVTSLPQVVAEIEESLA